MSEIYLGYSVQLQPSPPKSITGYKKRDKSFNRNYLEDKSKKSMNGKEDNSSYT